MAPRKKILIVDDEPDIVEFVEYNLCRELFETLKAFDGPTAMRIAREQQPDLVIEETIFELKKNYIGPLI